MSFGRKAMGQQPGVVLEERLANWEKKKANQCLPSAKPLPPSLSSFFPRSLPASVAKHVGGARTLSFRK